MPPVDVRIEERDNGLFLLWAPNPNAPQALGLPGAWIGRAWSAAAR